MSKIAILGDTHFGARGDSLLFHEAYRKFYEEIFFPYLVEHNIKQVVQLGDIFDKKKGVNFLTLYKAKEYFFDRLEDLDIEMIVLAGNHDTYFRHSNEVNAPRLLLKEYRGIRVVDEPEVLSVGDIEAVVLPWICKDNEKEVKRLLESVNTKVLFGHLELTGFCMYKGIPNAHGADPKIFDKFDMVFTGHFHHRSSSGNIHYLGTPYELTWMDYNDPRGFHIFDTNSMDLTFIENPYKMFHKVAFDDEGKDLETILDIDTKCFLDAYVQVVVVKKTNPYYLDMFIKHLEQSGAADVKVSENALSLELNDEQVIDVEDTLSILKEAVDSIDTSVPKDNLSQFMVKLYTEAKQIEV